MIIKTLIVVNTIAWVLLALDAAVVALVVGFMGFIANMITLYVNQQQNKRLSNMGVKQDKIAENVDGKIDALLAANKRADIAESAVVTRAEIKAEQEIENSIKPDAKPIEVIVVEPPESKK